MPSCILCNTRKPRRNCPAVTGEICAQCCAEQREEKLECPLNCEFLMEARRHEKLVPVANSDMPHPEVRVTEEFLNSHDPLVRYAMIAVAVAAATTPGAADADAREALDAYVQTLKTADSGLIYETKPVNPFAAAIQERIKTQVAKLNADVAERAGGAGLRDKDWLGVFVILSRVAVANNNGRRKGRAFIHMLLGRLPAGAPLEAEADDTGLADKSAPSGLIITP